MAVRRGWGINITHGEEIEAAAHLKMIGHDNKNILNMKKEIRVAIGHRLWVLSSNASGMRICGWIAVN